MISIGVTGWGDHDSLYQAGTRSTDKLRTYSSYFPVVEVDSSFYAIQPQRNYEKWIKETPDNFSFIVKAYQGMTGHARSEVPFSSHKEMFDAFKESLQPLLDAHKLKAVLFQYPPWFQCTKENVQILRTTRQIMGDLPLALEFRNQTWFTEERREATLSFMKSEGWIHTVCDEPQAGQGSVPIVAATTSKEMALVRLHGRNVHGWVNQGQPNWRDVRYLYRYNEKELLQWQQYVEQLQKETKDVVVLFNNNSGGDAADNARSFISMLQIEYDGLSPRQMNLF
ncbi:hypothetical protein A374_02894 [Fictibacillus macauensis ZFHKF-1]|uniref:YunF n=1 Tax=Fictibacillus macauensis ZFHKF-1 TaxID=1196324 RepID=I8J5T6_9BACL|nr:DUF72 domain-containing protein [Fictibacillus macauensis]EIT87166.1 hypothetical protein A374_02894 [Fictibacillus macauensis ZFHKF-1]